MQLSAGLPWNPLPPAPLSAEPLSADARAVLIPGAMQVHQATPYLLKAKNIFIFFCMLGEKNVLVAGHLQD